MLRLSIKRFHQQRAGGSGPRHARRRNRNRALRLEVDAASEDSAGYNPVHNPQPGTDRLQVLQPVS
ncbi:hypothetical protein D3OALGA1CA_5860 [Olavius algarvensis associated proteobacterium Delta 3]|nr:hypothetical protein D3OALGB2SA_1292 [Olavius algarvensis associated proteobacterium Delta 3]CAB5172740.1 hypothetical protein D3OALGA1CA_5860 [Olavius algarvensis associated proteobacterium Delta 3]